jgi:hypothetical protein
MAYDVIRPGDIAGARDPAAGVGDGLVDVIDLGISLEQMGYR